MKARRYQIRIDGWIGERWRNWFEGMTLAHESDESGQGTGPTTVLTGPATDQAALRGHLARIWDLNLELISVIRLDDNVEEEG